MKKTKMFVVYGVILILCVVAFSGFFLSKQSKTTAKQSENTETTTASSTILEATVDETEVDNSTENIPEKVLQKMKKSTEIPDPNPIIGIGRERITMK